ncbi:nuclease-related domain-containing protein [Levilinea saccharolytica]|uniref:NERD domain-containing protein n=1 Tax=Levilinea saccharolytica TaxID=229921 RepID=A0A0P6YN96_9CHLR|nr:nuclease-related domain-containing protein [Levilinea saccharolytica]KPL91745.1 hypothetical protein ADN01_00145 [Levilinea saccharolytica]GAP17536.1 protein containing nuclease-related domain [Levilinea saccharolytica]
MKTYRPEILEAIRLQKEGQTEASRQLILSYLHEKEDMIDALLWLARASDQPREAIAAAELAFIIAPDNEIAQRAVTSVAQKFAGKDLRAPQFELLRLTGMTEAQARSVYWPFKKLNAPIGVLLDEKKITMQDLIWAADNVQDGLIKQAARTILLTQLHQGDLKAPPKPLKALEGRENLEYRERVASVNTGIYLGFVVALAILTMVLWIGSSFFNWTDNGWVTPLNLAAFVIAFILLRLADRATNEMVNYKTGRRGERRVLDLLRAYLASPWVLVHNLEWPNRKWGDADIILVGPGGIWCLEVKNYSTRTRNIGDRWQYKSRFGWRNTSKHPGKQARRTAQTVQTYLQNHNVLVRWVQPVVVWAGEDDLLTVEDPAVPVWKLGELETQLEILWRQEKVPTEEIDKAVALFETIIRKAHEKK